MLNMWAGRVVWFFTLPILREGASIAVGGGKCVMDDTYRRVYTVLEVLRGLLE